MEVIVLPDELIRIEEEAKDFIKGRGGIVTIGAPNTGNLCCGKVNFAPEIKISEPSDPRNYLLGTVDGVKIYQHRDIMPSPSLSVGLAKILGFKYLVLNGWKLI